MYDFGSPDPTYFFSTAAGPDAQDLYGPPQSALDLYADGTPMAASSSAIANAVGSGRAPLWARADFHALMLMIVGAAMIHFHMES